MNRRQFLKRIGAACAVAVNVPVVLVVGREEPVIEDKDIPYGVPYWIGNNDSYIGVKSTKNTITGERKWVHIYDEFSFEPFPTEADRIRYRRVCGL